MTVQDFFTLLIDTLTYDIQQELERLMGLETIEKS